MIFSFKEFDVHQDRCAMKIGTDGVLLGSWASLDNNPETILDIGTGTGVIALMLAQRSTAATVDALEIDGQAYEQAVENFERSDWGDRLFCYHASFAEFVEEMEAESYDLIITNPPFYTDTFKSANASRHLARSEETLPFDQLLSGVSRLLTEKGKFSVIIPYKEEDAFCKLAKQKRLYPVKITRIRGRNKSPLIRSLILFELGRISAETTKSVEMDELTIEMERHQYTTDYIALTKDFYLNL